MHANLASNICLSCAGVYRSRLLSVWCAGCQQLEIPASSPFSLQAVLSNPVELLEWSVQGLPTDTVSQLLSVACCVHYAHFATT
jgi:hypothetical protein